MLDNKIRIRSSKELLVRKKEFLKICKILDKLNIKYFLHTGVLLGAIRHKYFIPWDWDVELGVFSENLLKKFDLLLNEILKSGFSIEKYSKDIESPKIDFIGKLKKESTAYVIQGWSFNSKKNIFFRKSYKVPKNFFLKMKKIKFLNKLHYAPYPPKKYLSYQYGNWNEPLLTSDKKLYMRKEYSGISSLKSMVDFLLFSLKKIILKFLR